MKRFAGAVALILGLAAPAVAQDAVTGMWKTEVDDGAYAHVQMVPCGDNGALVCGRIARTFNASGEYQSENIGKWLVRNMEPQGDGRYRGSVWRPSNDKVYTGKMNLNGSSLELAGCVAGGLLCSSQTWTRVQ